jgi:hypothetical protein
MKVSHGIARLPWLENENSRQAHMSKDDHPIRNKIIASVVAGLILSTLAYVFYAAPDVFRWIGGALSSIWNHLTSSLSIPYWLLWLLLILSTATVIRVFRSLSKRDEINEPTFRMYTQDYFEGVTWRWSYDVYDRLTDLSSYCPNCDALLVHMKEPFQLGPASSVRFYCEHCEQVRAEIKGGGRNYAESKIQRLIDRKIRSGEWKLLIKRELAS